MVLFVGLHNFIMVNYGVALQIGACSWRQIAAPTARYGGVLVKSVPTDKPQVLRATWKMERLPPAIGYGNCFATLEREPLVRCIIDCAYRFSLCLVPVPH